MTINSYLKKKKEKKNKRKKRKGKPLTTLTQHLGLRMRMNEYQIKYNQKIK